MLFVVQARLLSAWQCMRTWVMASDTLLDDINPDSVRVLNAVVEPAIMAHQSPRFQFERQGYFCKDPSLPNVFNKTVSLREGF